MTLVTSDTQLAAQHLKAGGLVAIPTETVYGLGADAENESAVAKIYQAKNRPNDHPVIVHISNQDLLRYWAKEIPEYAFALMAAFWPGPMTLIMNRQPVAKDFITGNQDTVGIRMPNHPVALDLLSRFEALGGKGIAAPSANRYGAVSPTNAAAVQQSLGNYLFEGDLILEGGDSQIGLESTIIDCTSERPRILRPGAITKEMVSDLLGINVEVLTTTDIRVSGSHKQHYSPDAKVMLNVEPKAGEGLIALAEMPTPQGAIRLAAPLTLEEYGQQLYGALRKADELGLERVCIFEPQGSGLAVAIRDRVTRAAAKG